MRLLKVCLVSSALLLCKGCANLRSSGVSAPYSLVYTAEGVPEDVATEFRQVGDALKAEGETAPPLLDGLAGSDIWGGWLNRAYGADTVTRVGVPPKDIPAALVDLTPTLGDAPFIADLPFGMIWTQDGQLDVTRGIAKSLGGYAIALERAARPRHHSLRPLGLCARWVGSDEGNEGEVGSARAV